MDDRTTACLTSDCNWARPRSAAPALMALMILVFLGLAPRLTWACACGCGVFEVGTGSMFASHPGGMAFLEYDYLGQNQNWHGTSAAPAADNDDKRLRTHFVTAGLQYTFNRQWGLIAQLPFAQRFFKTAGDDGEIDSFDHSALGDLRIEGVYTGLSEDMSTGITFGMKFPTGDYTYPNFDRDTEIGSGSFDFLVGAYHVGSFGLGPFAPGQELGWFAQILWDRAFATQAGYRPGDELNTALGIDYDLGPLGKITEFAPVLELISSNRWRDSGSEADPENTGYDRLILTPGIEIGAGNVRIFADVGFPVFLNMNGDQIIARELYKLVVSYMF